MCFVLFFVNKDVAIDWLSTLVHNGFDIEKLRVDNVENVLFQCTATGRKSNLLKQFLP